MINLRTVFTGDCLSRGAIHSNPAQGAISPISIDQFKSAIRVNCTFGGFKLRAQILFEEMFARVTKSKIRRLVTLFGIAEFSHIISQYYNFVQIADCIVRFLGSHDVVLQISKRR
jgi:hypothetical protein